MEDCLPEDVSRRILDHLSLRMRLMVNKTTQERVLDNLDCENTADMLVNERLELVREVVEKVECGACGEQWAWWLFDDDWQKVFACLEPEEKGIDDNPTWSAVTRCVHQAVAIISKGRAYVEPDDVEKDECVRCPPFPTIRDHHKGWDCELCHHGTGDNCPGCGHPVCYCTGARKRA